MVYKTRGSEGWGFQIGETHIYAGPGVRGTKAPAVLAFSRPGDTTPTVVADFRSSTAAEKFIENLKQGIDEGTAHKPIPIPDLVEAIEATRALPESLSREEFVRQQFEAAGIPVEVVDERTPEVTP